jgi:hypothetical protein
MKIIKFKAENYQTGKTVYSMTISNGHIKRKKDWILIEHSPNNWSRIKPETLGQLLRVLPNGQELYTNSECTYLDYDRVSECDSMNQGFIEWDEDELSYSFTNRWSIDMCEIDWDKVTVI